MEAQGGGYNSSQRGSGSAAPAGDAGVSACPLSAPSASSSSSSPSPSTVASQSTASTSYSSAASAGSPSSSPCAPPTRPVSRLHTSEQRDDFHATLLTLGGALKKLARMVVEGTSSESSLTTSSPSSFDNRFSSERLDDSAVGSQNSRAARPGVHFEVLLQSGREASRDGGPAFSWENDKNLTKLVLALSRDSDAVVSDLTHQWLSANLHAVSTAAHGQYLAASAVSGSLNAGPGVRHLHQHDAGMPHGPLRTFCPIVQDSAVFALAEAPELRQVQRQLERDPSDSAAAARLRELVGTLTQAVKSAAVHRCCTAPDIARECREVVKAGDSNFSPVYDAVWKRICDNDTQETGQKYQSMAAGLSFPSKDIRQSTNDPVQLIKDAARVKPVYNRLVRRLVGQIPNVELSLPPMLKSIVRIVEKSVLNPRDVGACDSIFDVVRGMAICNDMAAITQILHSIQSCSDLSLVRMKERFFSEPTSGGWRDCMLCFVIESDEVVAPHDPHSTMGLGSTDYNNVEVLPRVGYERHVNGALPGRHVCELQIVHRDLLTARKGLPGHAIYNRVRNAQELLTMMRACRSHSLFTAVAKEVGLPGHRWTLDDARRAGFSPSDEFAAELTCDRWGNDGAVLVEIAAVAARWKKVKWGYHHPNDWKRPIQEWVGVSATTSAGTPHAAVTAVDLPSVSWQLDGPLSPAFGRLLSLTRLCLPDNRLTGPLPTTFGALHCLQYLLLDANNLTGPIPSEITNLPHLETLSLANNALEGPLPLDFGPRISLLNFDNNRLTGAVPSRLSELAGTLTCLRLHGNALTGSLPAELCVLSCIEHLGLGKNKLHGRLPLEIGKLTALTELNLVGNSFSGPIPTSMGRLTRLAKLLLDGNAFSGQIPSAIETSFPNLVNLGLQQNNFDDLAEFTSRLELLRPECTMTSRFEYYSKERHIGRNNLTALDVVKDERGRRCIMKTVPRSSISRQNGSLVHEAKVLRSLRHPNIVGFIEAFNIGFGRRFCCVILEHCDGGTLRMRIKARRKSGRLFTQRLVLHWAVQLLQAMAYLEEQNVAHGALCPEHIFLKHGAKIVKLGEFSQSQIRSQEREDNLEGHSQNPSPAQCAVETDVISTVPLTRLSYFSPESLAQGSLRASIKSDAWAIGCVLREVCCLEVPFAAKNFSELAQRLKRVATPRPLPSRFDQNISRFTTLLLNHRPEARASILHDIVNDPFIVEHTRDISNRLGDLWPVACIHGDAGTNARNSVDSPTLPSILDTNSTHDLAVGDLVEGNYRGKGKWYGGKVTRVHFQSEDCRNTCPQRCIAVDILYDDGDKEQDVPLPHVRVSGKRSTVPPVPRGLGAYHSPSSTTRALPSTSASFSSREPSSKSAGFFEFI